MKNKTLMIIILVLAGLLLVGSLLIKLGVVNGATTYEAQAKEIEQVSSVEELERDKLYIWKDFSEKKISSSKNTFQVCPKGKQNYDKNSRKGGSAYYTVWMNSGEDEEIPTLTSKDKLVFATANSIPEIYNFSRLYDNGYSFGITSLRPDSAEHYYINYADSDDEEYEQYLNMDSDAAELGGLGVQRLYLDKVGKTKITDKYVAKNGVVTGLKRDKKYKCTFYIGSYYQEYILTANQRTFTDFNEEFECTGCDFLESCISIDIPEWLCSGYYSVNGMGMFRYVDDNDLAAYNGEAYDENIDWNKPLIIYDESGQVIFDPSQPQEGEETEEQTEGTEAEEPNEVITEATIIDSSEWTHEITDGKKFTAEISVSEIVNTEPAVLTVTSPDGETEEYIEENGTIAADIYEPKKGTYTFKIEKLGGRTYTAKYSDGGQDSGPNMEGNESSNEVNEENEENH
ncbi:MAG: cupredoxin domain-containing protein [Pseudobutyrivibrio sp.]|nr:cupredoxin domain-containing protein [Pseudobutyrivibrio sp.]